MKSQEQINNELKSVWPNLEIISEYTGANNKVKIRCTDCGHEWEAIARSVIHSKHGCVKCGVKKAFVQKSLTLFKSKLNDQFELIEFIDHTNVTVKCKKCGNIRQTTADNILRYGCKQCSMKSILKTQTKTLEEFIQQAQLIHEDKYDYSKVNYVNTKTKVCIICPEHGEFWQKPAKHLKGQGCPKCIGRHQTFEQFLQKARNTHGDYYDYSQSNYINMTTPIKVICPKHGDFEIIPNVHINQKCGCHQCHESSGEKLVNSILTFLNIPFTREVSILNPYNSNHNFRVDFYINYNNQNYIIEYNGLQHYKSVKIMKGDLGLQIRQERDEHLRKYCKENNINLLEIKYNDKNIQEKIEQFLNVPSDLVTDQIITEQKR